MHALAKKGNLTGRTSSSLCASRIAIRKAHRHTHGPSLYARLIAIRTAHRHTQGPSPYARPIASRKCRRHSRKAFPSTKNASPSTKSTPHAPWNSSYRRRESPRPRIVNENLLVPAASTRIPSAAVCRRWALVSHPRTNTRKHEPTILRQLPPAPPNLFAPLGPRLIRCSISSSASSFPSVYPTCIVLLIGMSDIRPPYIVALRSEALQYHPAGRSPSVSPCGKKPYKIISRSLATEASIAPTHLPSRQRTFHRANAPSIAPPHIPLPSLAAWA